jgi:putative transposase
MLSMDRGKWVKYRRCKRYDVAGHAHYLTFSCWCGLELLNADRTREWLADGIQAARQVFPFDLWAWVFMPEHAHMLVLPHEGVAISKLLKRIKEPVPKRAVAWVRSNRPEFLPRLLDVQPSGRHTHRFWQPGGGYDRNIWTAKDVHEKIHYIHANPVRGGLVGSPEEWRWSSCRAWEEGVDEPLAIDRGSLPQIER